MSCLARFVFVLFSSPRRLKNLISLKIIELLRSVDEENTFFRCREKCSYDVLVVFIPRQHSSTEQSDLIHVS